MPRLGVNIDHIATLREARKGIEPEPVFAALISQAAGADGIVAHLREDRRHIKERDLYLLKEVVRVKLNLEMSLAADIVEIAGKLKPAQATFVPEKRQELTTEGGLDTAANFIKVKRAVAKMHNCGIEVSLFIDPDNRNIDCASDTGAGIVELHTGRYANAKSQKEQKRRLDELTAAALYAKDKGLYVSAGHGLDYYNVTPVARIAEIEELNIGYAIICRAALAGLERAVREMISLINP